MILRTKWVCPNCQELSPTRHWSVQRHIQRKHEDLGKPISINTHQTRAQMRMGSGSSSYCANPRVDNFSNLENQKIPFRSFSHPFHDSHSNESVGRYRPDDFQKNPAQELCNMPELNGTEYNHRLASKFQEIKRLSRSFSSPQSVDYLLGNLSLLVMKDAEWESLIDGILERLRNNGNLLMGIFPQKKEDPLHNHPLARQLPEDARNKLAEIKLLLKPYYHEAVLWEIIEDLIRKFNVTNDYSILSSALEGYKEKLKNTKGEYFINSPSVGKINLNVTPFPFKS